jgi:hypothetical protein
MTLRRMGAEIFTEDPGPLIETLIGLGYELEVIDWPDDDGTTIVATTLTELEEIAFFHHVAAIVGPREGTVLEAWLVWKPGSIPKPGLAKRRRAHRY